MSEFVEVYRKYHPIDELALRKELSRMKVCDVKKWATTLGVSADVLLAADDAHNVKHAVIDLVVQKYS